MRQAGCDYIKLDRGYYTRYHTRYAAAHGTLRPEYAHSRTQGHPNGVQRRELTRYHGRLSAGGGLVIYLGGAGGWS